MNESREGNDSPSFDSAMQARTPGRDIFGELDDDLPPIRVPAQVKVDVRRAAHAMGLDVTAWLRLNVYASLYGPEHVATLHQRQLERVLGNAKRMAAEEGGSEAMNARGVPSILRSGSRA